MLCRPIAPGSKRSRTKSGTDPVVQRRRPGIAPALDPLPRASLGRRKVRLNQAATDLLRPISYRCARENRRGGDGVASRALFGHILVTMVLVCASSTVLPAQGFRQPQVSMPIEDQPGFVPDTSAEQLPAAYRRQLVFYRTTEAPGTIIVHTSERFLYLVQGNNRAVRYGIGVGRDGFQWSGLLKVSRKAEWPDWRPPPEMIERQPYLPRFMGRHPAIRSARGHSISARPVPHSRHQPAPDHRPVGVVGLLPAGQSRRDRPVRPGSRRHQGGGAPDPEM